MRHIGKDTASFKIKAAVHVLLQQVCPQHWKLHMRPRRAQLWPGGSKLIILGKFVARVGKSTNIWQDVISKIRVKKTKFGEGFLLTKYLEHKLTSSHPPPHSRNWHGYISTWMRDNHDACLHPSITCTDNYWTDNYLICSINLLPKHQHQHQQKSCHKVDQYWSPYGPQLFSGSISKTSHQPPTSRNIKVFTAYQLVSTVLVPRGRR